MSDVNMVSMIHKMYLKNYITSIIYNLKKLWYSVRMGQSQALLNTAVGFLWRLCTA